MNENFDDPAERLRHAAQSSPAAPELADEIVANAADHKAPRLVRRGRAARGAGIAFVAVAAVSAGALVVPGLLAPSAPLFTSAGGSTGAEAAALSADSKIAAWVNYEYTAGAGLGTSGGDGTVYELRRTGEPLQVLADAADALGLDGEGTEASYSSDEYPSYIVGSEDGTAASLVLSWSGTGSWWYNDPAAYPAQVCEQVPLVTEDGTSTETYEQCTQPQVPASESLAPSADEAKALAARIFAETGFDVRESQIKVTADEWQTVATAGLVVDGVATAVEASISWSPLGKIAWASGHSVEVVERGDFGTVSATSGVDRLQDWRWYGAAGPDYTGGAVAFAADSGLARGAAESTTPSEPAEEPSEAPATDPATSPETEPAPSDTPAEPAPSVEPAPDGDTIDPGIVEPGPLPEPETVTVTLEHAEATLLMLWDADGNAWLVPGYAYENPEQGFWTTVVSLVEGVIALPEPVEVEPLPAVID